MNWTGFDYIAYCNFNPEPPNDGKIYCPAILDGVRICWNYTEANTTVTQPCPPLEGFDQSEIAKKFCTSNGTWFKQHGVIWTDLSGCVSKDKNIHLPYVYYVGYSLSVICLTISLFVFFFYKQLSCDRITLHKNLFLCHLINALSWILFYAIMSDSNVVQQNPIYCQVIFIISTYFGVGTYFWMFSEGLYLAVILVVTFSRGKKLLVLCIITGWGVPLILTIVYIIVRYIKEKPTRCWIEHTKVYMIVAIPIMVALAINLIILFFILKMLITKLRHPSNREEAQYGKTTKAVFILIPLLGLQNVLFLFNFSEQNIYSNIQDYLTAILSSFQGVLVSFILCFFNQEVRGIFRRRTCQHRMLQHRKSSRRSTFTTELNPNSNNPNRTIVMNRMNSLRPSIVL